jgi:hypothetical protein
MKVDGASKHSLVVSSPFEGLNRWSKFNGPAMPFGSMGLKNFLTIAQLEEALFTQINRLSRETFTSLTGYSYILKALHIQVK